MKKYEKIMEYIERSNINRNNYKEQVDYELARLVETSENIKLYEKTINRRNKLEKIRVKNGSNN